MNIHKNARLTPLRREEMALSVIEGAFSKAHAARVYGVSAEDRGALGRALQGRRAGRHDRPFLAARPYATGRPLRRSPSASWRCGGNAGPASTSPMRSASRPPPSAGFSSVPDCRGCRDIEPAEPVRRYEREHPGEMIHIDIKKLGRFERSRPSHHRRSHRQCQLARRRLGVRPCLHRRRLPHRLLADPARREEGERRRLPQGGGRLLRQPRRHGRARHDRQRLLLQIEGLRQGLPRSRPQAHQHQALYAQDQRQGRALHPDRAARMGLCHRLSDFRSPRRRVAGLAAPIQLASSARQPKIQNAYQSPRL